MQIYKKSGAKKSLQFMDSEEVMKSEEKTVKLLSERWIFKANMNIIENNYAKVEEFYKKAMGINFSPFNVVVAYCNFLDKQNSYQRAIELYEKLQKQKLLQKEKAGVLNNLALLYDKVNRVKEAEEAYFEALKIYRDLAKTNPSTYNSDVAMTLNNLANLYYKVNRVKEPEEAYLEALKIYRELAKINPRAYGIDLANSLIMGALLSDKYIKNLDEAEKILQQFRGVPKAEQLLKIISELKNK